MLRQVEVCRHRTGEQYSAGTKVRAIVDFLRTSKRVPHFVPASRRSKLHRELTFFQSWDRCFL